MKFVKGIAFSCPHSGVTSEEWFNWLIKQIEDFKPQFMVNLGDNYEGKIAKRWAKWEDEKWTHLDEHKAAARLAREINERVEGEKVWLYGNHDDNVFGTQPDRIPADMRDALHWRNNVETAQAFQDWKVYETYTHRTYHRIGQVTFQHGCATNQTAEKDAAYLYGVPHGLYVCGHTHRPVPVTRAQERKVRLPYWYANAGCGVDYSRLHYMDRLSTGLWGRGCLAIEISESSVSNSKAFYGSSQWSAELRIESWAH
jgi:predicted MPP superfamily phosphohydrolase